MKFDQAFMIGTCEVIPIEYAIKFDGHAKQSIQPKFIEVLCYLAKHFPRVIPREELIENVWAGNNYVGEKALTNAIWHLRQSLKGINDEDETIETIRKVGYRLLVEPQYITDSRDETVAVSAQQVPHSKINRQKIAVYALIAALTVGLIFSFINTSQNFDQAVITQITKSPGSELFPAPSPDGRQVVFKWLNDKHSSNLYIKDRNNPQLLPKQLTFGSAYVGHSVWSNDGQYLYFSRKDKSNDVCQVIQLKVLTQQEKPIVDCPTNGGYYYLDISPDDKTLAFHGYSEPADDSGIYFIDLTNSTSQPVRFSCRNHCDYRERDFAFSPDGKSIAVTRRVNRFNENIYLVNLTTKKAEQLTKGEEDIVGLTWHPDGDKLVYGAQRADIRRGYILDVHSKAITNFQFEGFSYPAFAKKSKELFYQQRYEKYYLASLSLDNNVASSPFPIIESEFSHLDPHYSSNRDRIAYASNESGFYELWISDTQGLNRQQLTFLKQTIRYPRWSHSGDKIAFLGPVESDKADKIYIYDLTSNKLSIVPSSHQIHNRPTWSWNDKAIISAVYEKEYVDLHYINIETGESTRISNDGSRFGIMTSPTTVLYTGERKGLWQLELTFDNQQLLNTHENNQPLNKVSGKVFKTTYTWDHTEQGVYFHQKYDKHHQISFYNYAEQQSTPILRLPRSTLRTSTTLSKITTSNELLFSRAYSPQADIKSLSHPLL
ncbi:winged helix-turn-helix domain-containing protein [Colwellia sp. 1_MG-2023]|uniref:winged helix-turn-helix domain-containing protein n=1 Tax=Colwellia sp. 1_MG-2023 TaxID=3062649 RepID=UPI0026E17EB1|nr:winged helix-turn-helix domain-containing protein [Colwellia sp. 1_MG-2023]MDO6446363.1 winged helix-turn-helix domain-containing protein [Colwellia sp. 1_MG-2023]